MPGQVSEETERAEAVFGKYLKVVLLLERLVGLMRTLACRKL